VVGVAVINVVIGIGALGVRVVEVLSAQRLPNVASNRVLLTVSMVESEADVLDNKGSVQLIRPASNPLTQRASARADERAALIADYQRGSKASRLYKLWSGAEKSLGSGNDVAISVVVEAGGQGSGLVLDIAHAARALVASNNNRLRFLRGYVVMPAESEPEKFLRAYAAFSEIHRYHTTTPLHPSVFHYSDEVGGDIPDTKYWQSKTVQRPFDLWYVVENRPSVEHTIAATIETGLLGETALTEGFASDTNISAQAGLRANHTVSTVQSVTVRLPVAEIAALWKVEDVLGGMDVLGVHQPESVLKQMADAVVFNPFGGDINWWKRNLTYERQLADELIRLSGDDRLEKLFNLPLVRNEQWRKQEDTFKFLYGEKPPSIDALTQIDGAMKAWYEEEPHHSLDATLTAIIEMGQNGSKFYVEMLRQMYEGVLNAALRQFEQLTGNAVLMPEEYAQVAERAAATLIRLSNALGEVASELSQRYTDARFGAFEKIRVALRPPTFSRAMMNMVQRVSPEKEAAEWIIGLISVARGRHLTLAASAAFSVAAERLTERAAQARQVDDAVVVWREALGRYRRTLIEQLGALIDGAGRVETWGMVRKTSYMSDFPKPSWKWGLGILRCNNQNLSLTEPDVDALLAMMFAYNDAASRLSVLDYLSDSLRTEQVVQWLSKRALSVYDTVEGLRGQQRGRLYVYEADSSPEERSIAEALTDGLREALGGSVVQVIYHPNPSIMTFAVEISGLMPLDNLRSVKRAQRAYLSAGPNSVPNAMPGELAVLKAYNTLLGNISPHRAVWPWFAPRALHLADKPDALILFWKAEITGLIRYQPAQEDVTMLRWVAHIPEHGALGRIDEGWVLTARHRSSTDDPSQSLLEALECFVINASYMDDTGRELGSGRLAETLPHTRKAWLAHAEALIVPDDLAEDMRGRWQVMVGLRPREDVRAEIENLMRLHRALERLATDLEARARHTDDEELSSVYQVSALLIRAEAKNQYEMIKARIR
jgi:hypothetical protein